MADPSKFDASAAEAPSKIDKIRDELVAKRGQLQELDRKRMAGEEYDEAAYFALRDEVKNLNELRERIVAREMGEDEFAKPRPLDALLDFLATYKVGLFFVVVIGISVYLLMTIPSGELTTPEERKKVQEALGRSPGGPNVGLVGGAVLDQVKDNMAAKGEKKTAPAPKRTPPKATPAPPSLPAADLPK